jgi:repressor LexA
MRKIDQIQQKLIDFFKQNTHEEWLTLREISTAIHVKHPQTTLNKLNQLVQMGFFVKEPQGYRLIKDNAQQDTNEVFYLPVYGFAQCGNQGKTIVNEYSQEKIPVTFAFVGISDIQNCFFMRAKGNSMEPKIQNGDLVLVKQQEYYDPYDYVLIVHNKLPKLKKIIQQDGKIRLESINRFFDKIEIDPYDDSKVIGVVKKVIKNF